METNNKILIVDDDEDICHLMERIVKSEKLPSKSVNKLENVINVVQDFDPKIIFLDNQLPDGTGVDQISSLKLKFPGLRVILVTGDTKPGLREEARDKGADLFITKPFSSSVIKEILHMFLPIGTNVWHAA